MQFCEIYRSGFYNFKMFTQQQQQQHFIFSLQMQILLHKKQNLSALLYMYTPQVKFLIETVIGCCRLKWISGRNNFKLVWFVFPLKFGAKEHTNQTTVYNVV